MSAQFIYTMHKVGRYHPPDRQVLENISLSFYPGAKIGVLGANGAGKSSLLKIMGGLDDGYTGEARLTPGFTVGYLEQEPTLDPDQGRPGQRDGRGRRGGLTAGRIRDGAGRLVRPRRRLREAREPEQADLENKIEAIGAWDLQRTIDIAMEALRTPAEGLRASSTSPVVSAAASPCAGCCCPSPTCSCSTSRPTTSTPSRWPGWSVTSQEYPGTVVAITHDRYFLDNVAGWILELDRGQGIPFEGNYSSWLEQKQGGSIRRSGSRTPRQRHPGPRAGVGAHGPQGSPGQGQGPAVGLRVPAWRRPRPTTRPTRRSRSTFPQDKRLGDQVIEVEHLAKGFGEKLLIEDLSFSLPPAGIVGVIGGNGAGKTTLFQHADLRPPPARPAGPSSPTAGRSPSASTVEMAYVDQSREILDADDDTVYEEITEGHDTLSGRRPRGQRSGLRRLVQLPGLGPAEAGVGAVRR